MILLVCGWEDNKFNRIVYSIKWKESKGIARIRQELNADMLGLVICAVFVSEAYYWLIKDKRNKWVIQNDSLFLKLSF